MQLQECIFKKTSLPVAALGADSQREAPWEEGEIHPVCTCDHRLWTDRTHFTGRTVTRGAPAMFSQPIFVLVCLAEQGCCFPSCGHEFCIGLRPYQLVLSYSHCVINSVSTDEYILCFPQTVQNQKSHWAGQLCLFLNYLYARYALPQGLERLSFP